MPNTKLNTRRLFLVLILAGLVLLPISAIVTASYLVIRQRQIEDANATATERSIIALNETYGPEARAAIENFESKWLTLAAYKDPSVQAELAASLYLKYLGFARRGNDLDEEPFWLITKFASVRSVRVIEFSHDRFKALAYIEESVDRISPQGEFIDSLPLQQSCGVYVFTREDGRWKLAAYFNATQTQSIERDWRDAPDWLKQIIGDLPEETIYYCDKHALEK